MDESVAMRDRFIRNMFRCGKSVKEIIEMFRDLDEVNVVEIVGVEVIYGTK